MRSAMLLAQPYWGHMSGWGVAGMWIGMLGMTLFLVALIALVAWLMRGTGRGTVLELQDRPQQILAERYARGEIDTEEFRERLDALQ